MVEFFYSSNNRKLAAPCSHCVCVEGHSRSKPWSVLSIYMTLLKMFLLKCGTIPFNTRGTMFKWDYYSDFFLILIFIFTGFVFGVLNCNAPNLLVERAQNVTGIFAVAVSIREEFQSLSSKICALSYLRVRRIRNRNKTLASFSGLLPASCCYVWKSGIFSFVFDVFSS